MEQVGVKAVLSSTDIINRWEEPPCNDLPKLVGSIKKIKQSVNDCLTDLVNKEKGSLNKSQKIVENSDDEEEEDVEDTISGFLKEAAAVKEMNKGNKRKVHESATLQKAKKRK